MTRAFRLVAGAVVAVGWLTAGAPTRAQSTSGQVSGTVRDASSEPVAGASVELRSQEHGAIRRAETDARGRFRVESVEPGPWSVVAKGPDGALSQTRVVWVRLQGSSEVSLRLGSGLVEEVDVSASPSRLTLEGSSGELRVGAAQTDVLPLRGRKVTDVALLDSSVRPSAPASYAGETGAVFVVNGQTGRSNSFLVDGLDNNDQLSGTGASSAFSQQVVREVVVLTHPFLPEFGRASGGVFNVVTSRGTNEPQTRFFLQGTASSWNSPGSFVSSLVPSSGADDAERRFQAGVSVSGPIQKEKSFYFGAFEHNGGRRPLTYTGFDRTQFALREQNVASVPGGVFAASDRDDNFFLRADFNLDPGNTLMVRLSGDEMLAHGMNVAGVATPESGFTVRRRGIQAAASWTRVLSPGALNELRVLVGASRFDQDARSTRPGVERPSGVFGGNSLNRQDRDETRLQLVDNVTLQRGPHVLKFGFDVTTSSTRVRVRFNPNGNFIYNSDLPFDPGDCQWALPGDVAGAVADGTYPFVYTYNDGTRCPGRPANILTYPAVLAVIVGQPDATLHNTQLSLFAQDSYRPVPQLLLDYGVRYDLSTFRLPAWARVSAATPNGGAGRDYDNLAPRIGFTFEPGAGRGERGLVVRGGAGVFYDKLVLAFPAVAAVTSGTRIDLLPLQSFATAITEKTVERDGIDSIRQILNFPDYFTLRFSTATELETPYAVQYHLGVEQPVGARGAWSAAAVRSRSRHVPLMTDLNPVTALAVNGCPEAGCPPNVPGTPLHAEPGVGSIAAITTDGRSWYSGLELGWRWQGESGWHRVSYTLSRAEDLGPDPLKGGVYLPAYRTGTAVDGLVPLDPFARRIAAERGRSDDDRRHRLVLAGETRLPWLRLRASAMLQYMSGAPFNVTTGQDNNSDGITSDRPNGIGRNTGAATPLAVANAFRASNGLPAVASLAEPEFVQLDVRLSRPFRFGSRKNDAELFVQVFNVTNRFNPGPMEGRLTAAGFGEPIGQVGPSRTLELGLRFGF